MSPPAHSGPPGPSPGPSRVFWGPACVEVSPLRSSASARPPKGPAVPCRSREAQAAGGSGSKEAGNFASPSGRLTDLPRGSGSRGDPRALSGRARRPRGRAKVPPLHSPAVAPPLSPPTYTAHHNHALPLSPPTTALTPPPSPRPSQPFTATPRPLPSIPGAATR